MTLTTNPTVWKVILVIALLVTILFSILFYFTPIFFGIVLGIAIIVVIEEFRDGFREEALRRKWSENKRILYGVAIVLFWVISISVLVFNSIHELTESMQTIRGQENSISEAFHEKVAPLLPDSIVKEPTRLVASAEKLIISTLSTALSGVSSVVVSSVLIVPLMIYMYYRRKDKILNTLISLVPVSFKRPLGRAIDDITKELHEYFSARVVESVIVGSIYCFGFYVAGVKGWLVLGALAGAFNIIPYLGPFLGAIIPVMLTLLVDETLVVFLVLLTFIIAQLIDNLYLVPFMLSSKVKMDPLLTILLILVGGKLLGVIGIIFAIPVFIVYKIILREAYEELVTLEVKNEN